MVIEIKNLRTEKLKNFKILKKNKNACFINISTKYKI